MERSKLELGSTPGRFLGSVDDERSNNDDDGTDNQYGEPNGIATCGNLAEG